MYKCSKCKNLLTEFDVAFHQNLFGKGECRCFDCAASGSPAIEMKRKKERKNNSINKITATVK